MTKVLELGRKASGATGVLARPFQVIALAFCLAIGTISSHAQTADPTCPQTTSALYSRIRSVELDPKRVYRIRDASIDRPSLHIDLDHGTLAFTEDICGRITGAYFDGEGEIRLRPPNLVERRSLALFTGMAILEEQFNSAYLRFNDDTAAVLQRSISPAPDSQEFITESSDTNRILAEFDGLRLLRDFSHFLPSSAPVDPDQKFPPMLHAHLLGKKLGAFEVLWDTTATESLWAGQPRVKDGILYFDVWTSFAPAASGAAPADPPQVDASISRFRIRATVQPPTRLQASTDVDVRIRTTGQRTLLFELSRYLKLDSVDVDGHPVDFIQNPAMQGSQLQRKGNDIVAVVFPAPLTAGQDLKLHFSYAGDVLSEAGNGLLYVGERGTWYPNFGLSPAQFDMEFHYPPDWTLVATGRQTQPAATSETNAAPNSEKIPDKISRWTSDRPIPVAGFNLGKYVRAEARAGNILVEAFGTKGVEKSFPKGKAEVIDQGTLPGSTARTRPRVPIVVTAPPSPPSPARDVQPVADNAARAITSFSQWFGPYPYSSLALTQMPGELSQGWPGLVFLSSYAFLSPQEQMDLRLDPVTRALDSQVLVHETAHQWWGDLVLWKSYRDQWIAEGLANYTSLLLLEQQNPAQFRQVLERYRRDLCTKNKDDQWLRDAGPVTLGPRLVSSHFPSGYELISYERGTWLFHMLRSMLRDAETTAGPGKRGNATKPASADELFFRALRKARDRYAGKSISTRELIHIFEEELPRPLWYEKRPKLDWFLESWIEGIAIPELESSDIRIAEKNGVTTVTGVIVQKDAPNDLVTAVPVYAVSANNTQVLLGEVLADGAETPFRLTAPSDTRKILLDPKQTVLTAPK